MTSSEDNSEDGFDECAPENAVAISQCRQCGSEHVDRVKKRGKEKLLGLFVPLSVYRCEYCFYRNRVFESNKRLAGMFILLLLLVAVFSFGYLHTSKPKSGGQQVEVTDSAKASGESEYYYDIDYRDRVTREPGSAQTGDIESNLRRSSQFFTDATKTTYKFFDNLAFVNASEQKLVDALMDGGDQQMASTSSTDPQEVAPDSEIDALVSAKAPSLAARKPDEPSAAASAAKANSEPPPVSPTRRQKSRGNNRGRDERGVWPTSDNPQINPLFALDGEKYTIQISSKRTRIEAIEFTRKLSKEMPGPFFYYRSRSTNQKPDWFPVLYGVYDSAALAKAAIAELPAALRGSNPYHRSIATIHKRVRGR